MKSILLLFLLCCNFINAQNEFTLNVGEIKEKEYYKAFDFENIKGKIIIDVKINNQIKKFILDTGAPLSISEKLSAEMQNKSVKSILVGDANSKEGQIEVVEIPEFSIDGLTFINSYALKISDMALFECFNVDGIIGSNSLRNSVVDFDFKTNKITLTNDVKKLGFSSKVKSNKLFKDFQSTPVIDVKMKLGYLNFHEELIFDSGDDSFYNLSKNSYYQLIDLINQKKMPKELQNMAPSELLGVVASSNGSFSLSLFGNDNNNIYYKFKIQDFVLGNTSFDNIVTTSTYGNSSRIGSEILKYGKLTLDYKKEKYYYQAYDNLEKIDVNDKIRSFFPTYDNNKFVIGIIWNEKVKDKMKVGDEILSINSIDFAKLSKCEIIKMSFESLNEFDTLVVTLRDVDTNEIKIVEVAN